MPAIPAATTSGSPGRRSRSTPPASTRPEPTRVHLYAFKNADVFDELRPFIDLCARSYVVDPADYATIDAPPYVFAGAGPWAADFERALRDALERAAVGG